MNFAGNCTNFFSLSERSELIHLFQFNNLMWGWFWKRYLLCFLLLSLIKNRPLSFNVQFSGWTLTLWQNVNLVVNNIWANFAPQKVSLNHCSVMQWYIHNREPITDKLIFGETSQRNICLLEIPSPRLWKSKTQQIHYMILEV